MIQFTNPTLLWALAGLSVPLVIHLLSRKEGKIIKVGSLRHIRETTTQQFKGIRINEVALLALRSILLALLCLFLSGLNYNRAADQRWVVVEPGLESTARLVPLLDSLQVQGYEVHTLCHGLPAGNSIDSTKIDYASLLRELAEAPVEAAIVFSRNRAANYFGKRTQLPEHIRWIGIPDEPAAFQVSTYQLSPDSVALRKGFTSSTETHFSTNKLARVNAMARPIPEVRVSILSDQHHRYDETIIKASLNAIELSVPVKINTINTATDKSSVDWCILLADERQPAINANKFLVLNPKPGQRLIHQISSNQWEITQRLNPEIALRENLTVELASMLVPRNAEMTTALANDRRMLPDEVLWSASRDARQARVGTVVADASPLLAVLILMTFLAERLLSYKRSQ